MDWVSVHTQREDEKAAALDRAIEYEDSVEADEPATDNQEPTRSSLMIDRQLLLDLDAAAGEVKAAEDKFRAICRKIGVVAEDGERLVPAMGVQTVNQTLVPGRDRGSNIKDQKSPGLGQGFPAWKAAVKDDPAKNGRKRSYKKVQCSVCREEMGSRLYEDVDYPVLHKNEQTGEACKGSFVAGLAIE